MTWNDNFLSLFDQCVAEYKSGNTDYNTYYTSENLEFLKSIGYKPREFFDFVEDLVDAGEPSRSTAALVASVRRDYLIVIQHGEHSSKEITHDDLPTFGDTLEGIAYLPRIIVKAQAKLKGELDPDIMYGCGGDRKFLKTHGDIHLADFLRNVWSAGDDVSKIVEFVKSQMN